MEIKIAEDLHPLVVAISAVTHNPTNTRLHPERNLAELKRSLTTYGQRKPIVAHVTTRYVLAGKAPISAAFRKFFLGATLWGCSGR